MSRIIDRGLEEQSVLLSRMGELTYETLELSMEGYLEGKSVQQLVREMSDISVSMADKVEDKTFELIARFQPVASDLRTIKSYMKIAYDFARYSRYALDIASINDDLHGLEECSEWGRDDIEAMSRKVLSMVKASVDSLRKLDVELAKSISETEKEVDKMYFDLLGKLLNEKQMDCKCAISFALMTRYLERIADHATYVCESIVYIVSGEKITLR
jgi:phosphate transport system protein